MGTAWREKYLGGDPLVEARLVRSFVNEIKQVQARIKDREHAPAILRAFHAKIQLGVTNAVFRVLPNLPADLQASLFQPGREYQATIRFSNANGAIRPDGEKDMRGVALRVINPHGASASGPTTDELHAHDFLMTSAAASHARDAQQFMTAAKAMAGGRGLGMILKLLFGLGPFEAIRMLLALSKGATVHNSLATLQYWSRAPIAFGNSLAVKYTLRPAREMLATPTSQPDLKDPDFLRRDFRERLRDGDLRYEFCIQRWVDENRTPLEDGTVLWDPQVSAEEPVADLIIPQDLSTDEAREVEAAVNRMQFNPWRTSEELRPLGSLNRARKLIYSVSSAHWTGRAEAAERHSIWSRMLEKTAHVFFGILNKFVPWHKLGKWSAALNLYAIRNQLRKENLYDTSTPLPAADPRLVPLDPAVVMQRTIDGSGNDLAEPNMGAVGRWFGRNMPLEELKRLYKRELDRGGLLDPNPRLISRELLTRHEFIPATTLNLLAAAWIQFQTHDWFNHGRNLKPTRPELIEIPLPEGDDWPDNPMRVPRTPADPTRTAKDAALDPLPTFRNVGSHWWDGSQIYGSDPEMTRKLREWKGGRLRLGALAEKRAARGLEADTANDLLPVDEHGLELSGFTDNWWVGLSLLHTLFAREHNAICERLERHHSGWDDERIFQTARLINTALLAKIHTVEWTPAILGTPTLKLAMSTNWWGMTGEKFKRALGRLSESEAISGIIDSLPDHHSASFTLTEEFVSVYRMHPLMPDRIPLRTLAVSDNPASAGGGAGEQLQWINVEDFLAEKVRNIHKTGLGLNDLFYSFGRTHPGAITLGNFPRFLQKLRTPFGFLDLGTIDVLRDRERGVPRYNDFRRMLHMPQISSFDKLNPKWADKLHRVYNGKIENLDALVGMQAEQPPHGFGFSDTAFRIFVLMASRRLKSDRFFTTDYSRDVYSQVGLDWIDENDMSSVILRHFPDVGPALNGLGNAFVPWEPVEYSRPQAQPTPPQTSEAQA